MIEGNYRYAANEGRIGGFVDDAGTYYVGEGHHRMTAAQEIFKDTGNPSYINKLIKHGSWTKTAKPPVGSNSLPTR